MRLVMLTTRLGSEDCFTVRQYRRGIAYDVADTLARCLLADGSARPAAPESHLTGERP